MKFSILIANYNNGKFFHDCYKSIISQTYSNWEVVIVDDHSTDDSFKKISAIIKNDDRFKISINSENMGCGYTKRECAIKAIGEIAGYLDPDDTLISDALELMIRAHKENPTVSLVHSRFYYCNELLERTSLYDRSKKVEVSDRFINLNSSVNHFASFKKILYDRTLGIDASVKRAVDQDLYLKLSEIGSFYFIDKPLYNYRVHLNGISISNTDQAFFWFLKVIMKTEQRRKINLEKEAAELLNRSNPYNMQINLVNPRYLILTILNAFKKNPIRFFKKLFLNRY